MLAYLGMPTLLSNSMTLPVGQPPKLKAAAPQPIMLAAAATVRTRWPVHTGAVFPAMWVPAGRRLNCELEKYLRVPAFVVPARGLAALAKMLADMQMDESVTTCDSF